MARASVPLLDEQICFALYSASRAMTQHYRELLAPLGVTYPQYLALLVLWESGETTVSGLGERLRLESGTLSPLLKRMERSGLITRRRAADDERTVLVDLTPAGSALRAKTLSFPELVCAASGLDPDSIQSLRDQIFDLADSVRAVSEK